MTFYEKLDMLCAERGTNITALTRVLGFSSSSGTTWKNMTKKFPRNSTLKKIADYFEISIAELKNGITDPIDYDNINTDEFNQTVWLHLLEKYQYDEHKAIDAYFEYQKTVDTEAMTEAYINDASIQDNHGIIGNTHAPVTIINGSERKLSEQELELLNVFGTLSVMDQAKLLVYANELKEANK